MSDINETGNSSDLSEQNHSEEISRDDKPKRLSDEWWATVASPKSQRCIAHRKNGNRCQRAAYAGQKVCGHHGGRAPAAIAAARRRLGEAAETMAQQLLKMATDPNVADAVKLKAITEALDRASVTSKTTVGVEISTSPHFEAIFDGAVEAGSRADYRRSQGITDDTTPPALASPDSFSPIDVEFSNDESGNVRSQGQPMSHDDSQRQSYGALAGQTGPLCADREGVVAAPNRYDAPTGDGMMSLEDALDAQAQMYRNAAATRGLPPGRTAHG